jgi:hypothetical protein
MLLSLALIVTAHPLIQEVLDWARPRFVAVGFGTFRQSPLDEDGGVGISITGQRAPGQGNFTMIVAFGPNAARDTAFFYSEVKRFFEPPQYVDPSNVLRNTSIGEAAYLYSSDQFQAPRAMALSGRLAVSVQMGYPTRKLDDVNTAQESPNRLADIALVKSILRQAVSRGAGYGICREWGAGEDYSNRVSLSTIRSTSGVTVTGDANSDQVEIKKGSHRLVLHLGSREVEVDNQGYEMRKPLMVRASEIYIPQGLWNRIK